MHPACSPVRTPHAHAHAHARRRALLQPVRPAHTDGRGTRGLVVLAGEEQVEASQDGRAAALDTPGGAAGHDTRPQAEQRQSPPTTPAAQQQPGRGNERQQPHGRGVGSRHTRVNLNKRRDCRDFSHFARAAKKSPRDARPHDCTHHIGRTLSGGRVCTSCLHRGRCTTTTAPEHGKIKFKMCDGQSTSTVTGFIFLLPKPDRLECRLMGKVSPRAGRGAQQRRRGRGAG